VKGSGGDLGSMKLDGFATLYLDKLESLRELYRGLEHEDEMVGYLPHCTFGLNPRAAAIDTPLHSFIPKAHVDHMHADAVIAIAAAKDAERLTREVFGGEIGWLPWQRPGFDLGLKLGQAARATRRSRNRARPATASSPGRQLEGVLPNTLRVIQKAADCSTPTASRSRSAAGREAARRQREAELLTELVPVLRGKLSAACAKLMHFDESPEVLEFVCASRCEELAAAAPRAPTTSCARRSGRWCLVRPGEGKGERRGRPARRSARGLQRALPGVLRALQARELAAMRDPYPVIVLVPGVGMLSFAEGQATRAIAAEYYVNAINVMRGPRACPSYVAISEQEAFDIEYWLLEGGQAAADAEAEEPRGPDRARDGGRRRDRRGGGAPAPGRRRLGADQRRRRFQGARGGAGGARVRARQGPRALLPLRRHREASVRESYARVLRELGGLDILVLERRDRLGSALSRRRRSSSGPRTSASSRPATSSWRARPTCS
jgi:rhamnose utilization protein RhaD (predicted bifunctional aldolase and dehydrogenase)